MTSRQKNKCVRRQLWIDEDVQGAIVWRVSVYWAACFLLITVPLVSISTWQDPSRSFVAHLGVVWQEFGPVYVSFLLLLPIILFDALRMSHRIAGPILRVRRQLVQINSGEPYSELHFRGSDFWQEMADQVNSLGRKTLT